MNPQRAIREYQDNSDTYRDELAQPYTGPFVKSYLDALSAAEREALCARGEPVELSAWRQIRGEFRAAPFHQQLGLVVFFGFGFGMAVALIGSFL